MIYFDNGSTSHPKAPGVADAVRDIIERGCFNINRGGYAGAYEVADLVFSTREKIAKLFDCPTGRQVVFTGGVTLALNIALKGLLRPGDRVVITQMEHNAVLRPLAQLRAQGVVVDTARCFTDGRLDLSDMEAKITERTRLVVMTHASNVCGAILPVREVGAICRARGARLLVDCAQTAGVLPISMRRDNIDILAFSGHKSLLATQGIGGLVLSQELAGEMVPLVAGGTGSYSETADMPAELPDRLEAGTLNIPGIAALSAALDYIEETGVENVYARETALLKHLTDSVNAVSGVRIAGPSNLADKIAVAALDFPDMDNAVVAARLDEEYGIMTRCGLHCAPDAHKALGTFPRGAVRCSLGYFNTETEIDLFADALKQIVKGR
ncbi:MAG: aminotransferase class V-fold PLP-dependent enzyme [Oscillospiraceae bacterium]|nr:aminotransferase class V-fold PLP-dependent enzyme [Oscillospiraceae bacterium]